MHSHRVPTILSMRLPIAVLILLTATSAGAQSQPSRTSHPVCFGVQLARAERCGTFAVTEIGVRGRLTGPTDHAERDRSHAYPVLQSHAFAVGGLLRPVGTRSALGVVAEIGGGDARQGIGVRYDRALAGPLRLDVTGGMMRVETHQVNVVKRTMTSGPFADATMHLADLAAIQLRGERFAGDGGRIRPGSALYVGARIEGKAGLESTAAGVAAMLIVMTILFFAGGEDT